MRPGLYSRPAYIWNNTVLILVILLFLLLSSSSFPSSYSVSLKVKSGELVAIVGVVGSGKSSLMSAVLGDMNKIQGQVSIKVSHSPNSHVTNL